MKPKENITGKRFGKLTVIECLGYVKNKKIFWKCKCDCGNETITTHYNLKNGHTMSCGCLRKGKEFSKYKHGLYRHKLYNVYHSMKQRCLNAKDYRYKDYGGRNITICDEWLDEDGFVNFSNWAFENGYADGLSIDRIDNNGNYCPDNCRWTDNTVQLNNTRHNKWVTYNGESHTYAEWERILNNGVKQTDISVRINKLGWSVEKALLTPIQAKEKPELYDWDETIIHNNEKKTAKEWCAKVGLSRDNYRSRIKLGWTKEKAATTPKIQTNDKAKELINR